MADYDRNLGDPGLNQPNLAEPGLNTTATDPLTRNRSGMNSPTSWIGGIIAAIVVILALGYLFSGPSTTNRTTEQRAAATDKTVAPPPATTARPAPSPSEPAK